MKNIIAWLKGAIGEQAANLLIAKLLTKENLKKFATSILDKAEELALKTETKIDDKIVAKLKEIANIE